MQTTSNLYKQIREAGNYVYEPRAVINNVTYGQDKIYSMVTKRRLFKEDKPAIGNAIAGEIDISLIAPEVEIPRMAKIVPYFRLKHPTLGTSEWIQKGVYHILTRRVDEETGKLIIHGCDAMRKTEAKYPSSTLTWSANSPMAQSVVSDIARYLGIQVDPDTNATLAETPYPVGFPVQYTIREVLESIAAMYGGNFCISDEGKLLLIGFADIPPETFYLVTESGDYITFGGTRILLK